MIRLTNKQYIITQTDLPTAHTVIHLKENKGNLPILHHSNNYDKNAIYTYKHIELEDMLDFVSSPIYYPYFHFIDDKVLLSLLFDGMKTTILCGLYSLSNHFYISFQNYMIDPEILARYSYNTIVTKEYDTLSIDEADSYLIESLFSRAIQPPPIKFSLPDITVIGLLEELVSFTKSIKPFRREITKNDYKFLHLIQEPQKHLKQLEMMLTLSDNWYTYKKLKLICSHEWDILHKVDNWTINEMYGIGGICKICGEQLMQIKELDIYDKPIFIKLYNYLNQEISDQKKRQVINAITNTISQFFNNQSYSDNNLMTYLYILFTILNKYLPFRYHFSNVSIESEVSIDDLNEYAKNEEKKITNYSGFHEIINLLTNDKIIISEHFYHPLLYSIVKDKKKSHPVPTDTDVSSYIKNSSFTDPSLESWKEVLNYNDFTIKLVKKEYETIKLENYPLAYNMINLKLKFSYVSNNVIKQTISKNKNSMEILHMVAPYLCPLNLIHQFNKNVCIFCKFNKKEQNYDDVMGLYEKYANVNEKEYDGKNTIFRNKNIKKLTLKDYINIASKNEYLNNNEVSLNIEDKANLIRYIFAINLSEKEIEMINDPYTFDTLLGYAKAMNRITREDINLFLYRIHTKRDKKLPTIRYTKNETNDDIEVPNFIEDDIYDIDDDVIEYD